MRFVLAIEVERTDGPPVGLDLVRRALGEEILGLDFSATRGAQPEPSRYRVFAASWPSGTVGGEGGEVP